MCMCMYIWPHVCINVFVGVRARDAEKTLLGFRIIMPTLATRRQPGDRRSIFFECRGPVRCAYIYVCVCICSFEMLLLLLSYFAFNLLPQSASLSLVRLCACQLLVCYYFAYRLFSFRVFVSLARGQLTSRMDRQSQFQQSSKDRVSCSTTALTKQIQ